MKRKVIQVGGKTMLISLPSSWIKKFKVNKGDELNILEKNNSLIISTNSRKVHSKDIYLDISKMDKGLVRLVLSAIHKSGYTKIKLSYKTNQQINTVEEMINEVMTGFEIIEQKDNICRVKMIAKNLDSEFDVSLRRIFLVSLSLAKDGLESIKNNDIEGLKSIIKKELINNKLTNFCESLINKEEFEKYNKKTFIYLIVWSLEGIADDYKDIYKILISSKKNLLNKSDIDLFSKVNDLLELYYKIFYNFNYLDLMKLNNRCKKLKNDLIKSGFKTEISPFKVFFFAIISKIKDLSASTIAYFL